MSATIELKKRHRWNYQTHLLMALAWCQCMRKRVGAAGEQSPWWIFIAQWPFQIEKWLKAFIAGKHSFTPMIYYQFTDEAIQVWSYVDRLMIYLLLRIIRPTFKYIISSACLHLKGPSAIKGATEQIKQALASNKFQYAIRLDIRSYYASVNHQILLEQLSQHFNDPIVLKYLHDIVTIGVDKGGQVFRPSQGIPRRSGISPFFGALYLSSLDNVFDKQKILLSLRVWMIL